MFPGSERLRWICRHDIPVPVERRMEKEKGGVSRPFVFQADRRVERGSLMTCFLRR
jgi:hypothetical protein